MMKTRWELLGITTAVEFLYGEKLTVSVWSVKGNGET